MPLPPLNSDDPLSDVTFGRAFLTQRAKQRHSKRPRGLSTFATALALVMDSGCTWHVHPVREDLVNLRPCNDRVEGVDRKVHPCTCMGDLPIVAQDAAGVHRQLLLQNVRCVPTIPDSLISIDQLWDDMRVDTQFRDIRSVFFPGEQTSSRQFPFERSAGLNMWHVYGNARDPARPFDRIRQQGAVLSIDSVRSTLATSTPSVPAE